MEPGVHKWISSQFRRTNSAAAVFLDRDGVLIEDSGYLAEANGIVSIPGSLEAVGKLNRAGMPVVLVTNQSGVGRGYYGWRQFEQVQSALRHSLAQHGAWLDAVWACAYHEDGIDEYRAENHLCRKPNPGMILQAASELGLSPAASWMVGDRVSDLEAGLRSGLRGVIHVLTGYGKQSRSDVAEMPDEQASRITQCENLAEAVELILGTRNNTCIEGNNNCE